MAQYNAGTVTVTNGSAIVNGAGTAWLANLAIGNYFVRSGDVVAYQIGSVDSDTQITLTAPYGGVTGSTQSYVAHISFLPNGAPEVDKTDAEYPAIFNRWASTSIPPAFGSAAQADIGTAPSEVPTNSDLGTAAFADATTSPTDRTVNRVKRTDDENVLSRDSVADISSLTNLYDGQKVILTGWHANSNVGGGTFTVDLTRAKADHNGGTILSLTMPFSNTTDYLNKAGETDPTGSGCLIREDADEFTPEIFGGIESSTDQTLVVQAAFDAMSATKWQKFNARYEYFVTTVSPKQRTIVTHARLKSFGNNGSLDPISHVPVMILGDNINPFVGFFAANLFIDGNRQAYANINLFAGGDGGMHGLLIRAKVEDCYFMNSEFTYAGTAGVALDWDTDQPPGNSAPQFAIKNILFDKCKFNFNREHGSFAAYCKDITYRDCEAKSNGLTLDPAYENDLNHGLHGADIGTVGSPNYFGRGIDIEAYNVQSAYDSVKIIRGEYTGNANGSIQFYDPTDTSLTDRHTSLNCGIFELVNCGPVATGSGRTINIQQGNPTGTKYGAQSMVIHASIDGQLRVNGVDGLTIDGFQYGTTDPTKSIEIFNSRQLSLPISYSSELDIDNTDNPTIFVEEGASSPSISTVEYTSPVSGICQITYRIFVTGGGVAGTLNKFRLEFANDLPLNVSRAPHVTQRPFSEPSTDYTNYRPLTYIGSDGHVRVVTNGDGNNYGFELTVNVRVGKT